MDGCDVHMLGLSRLVSFRLFALSHGIFCHLAFLRPRVALLPDVDVACLEFTQSHCLDIVLFG
jgi:hypothetical protein